jgi:rubrerythrin
MQKLMAEPYVIRCFNATSDDNKKNSLEARRKELEQRLEKEVERQNHRKVLQQAISAQEQKEEKMMNKVKEIVELSNRKLEDRIRRRAEASEMRNSILNSSQFIASEGSFYS